MDSNELSDNEFIVAYCKNFCNVASLWADHFHRPPECSMKAEYERALSRFKKSWGDVVGWNNCFWGAVKADNARDAIDQLMGKVQEARARGEI